MSALTHSRKGDVSSASSVWGSLIEWLAIIATRYARTVSQRRALDELARLDDRMLKDIGLFRDDIDVRRFFAVRRRDPPFALPRLATGGAKQCPFREALSLIPAVYGGAFPIPRLPT